MLLLLLLLLMLLLLMMEDIGRRGRRREFLRIFLLILFDGRRDSAGRGFADADTFADAETRGRKNEVRRFLFRRFFRRRRRRYRRRRRRFVGGGGVDYVDDGSSAVDRVLSEFVLRVGLSAVPFRVTQDGVGSGVGAAEGFGVWLMTRRSFFFFFIFFLLFSHFSFLIFSFFLDESVIIRCCCQRYLGR